jgi:hypothetical protein
MVARIAASSKIAGVIHHRIGGGGATPPPPSMGVSRRTSRAGLSGSTVRERIIRVTQSSGGRNRLYMALIIAAATLPVAGCGGGDTSSGTTSPYVATVQGRPVSAASLAHWIRIENARLYGPAAPFPDPPRYRRCAAAAKLLRARSERPPLPPRELRLRCARTYTQLKDKALAFLITAKWIEGEAAARGIRVSPAEVKATYGRLRNGLAGRTFAANLRRAGMSKSDELLQLRLEALAQGLSTRLRAGHGTVSAATVAGYRRRWKRRTTCRAGYVMHDCGNYQAAAERHK